MKYSEINNLTYQQAWHMQQNLLKELVDLKLEKRHKKDSDLPKPLHQLLFCEHQPVFTLGKSGSIENLLLSEKELKDEDIEFFKINRGGDITYHGPGQITGYPIFDLDEFFTDIHRYVRTIEQIAIDTMGHYGLEGDRIKEYTGVWIKAKSEEEKDRKICAIGVHLSRWVTMHGFAFNVNTDLNYFDKIIPCGIEGKEVTSLKKELGHEIDMQEVRDILKSQFSEHFGFEYINNI